MRWLRQLFTRRQIYSDLSEEIRLHLSEKVEYLVAGGMSRTDAEYAAKRLEDHHLQRAAKEVARFRFRGGIHRHMSNKPRLK